MPTVKQLLDNLNQDKKSVVTAEANESLAVALNKMLKHDFTQLPFKEENRYYFVTTTSILGALSSYGGTISETRLNVSHAKISLTATHTEDDDIFDVMADIERIGAALIVDDKGEIRNILTTYDTAIFFQQWSEDTMHVREIERGLKDIINLTFKDQDGNLDISSRQAAVDSVSSNIFMSKDKLLKGLKIIHHIGLLPKTKIDHNLFNECFENILQSPMDRGADTGGAVIKIAGSTVKDIKSGMESYFQKMLKDEIPADTILKKAFPDAFGDGIENPEFDNLALGQYIQILLGPSWQKCQSAFKIDKESVSFILEGVRKTRNKLAHFHDEEITTQDRLQLTQCNDLLRKTKRDMSS